MNQETNQNGNNQSEMKHTVMDLVQKRVSLRVYDERPLSKEDRDAILEGAMRAPTAGNMMLYSMLVISDPALKQRLSETCDHQPFIAKAPFLVVFLADMQRWFDFFQASDVKEYCGKKNLPFTGPDEADLLLASCDALIAAQNSVLVAESRGIGSCYIGDIMENYETHRELLNLPPWVFPITMLCFGYYKEKRPAPRSRFDQKFVVFENGYKRLEKKDFTEMFAKNEAGLRPGNSFAAENYGQFMYARKIGSDYSAEMARSVREALKNWTGKKL